MMDALDFSVPVTGSGKFIELNAAGSLPKLQPLWSKYCGLRKHLENVEEKLCLCNEPSWLLGFAKKCQRQKKDELFHMCLLRAFEQSNVDGFSADVPRHGGESGPDNRASGRSHLNAPRSGDRRL